MAWFWRVLSLLGWIVAVLLSVLAAGYVWETLAESGDARRFPAPGTLVDVGGRRLHLLCKGEGGPTVVIEQGAGEPSLLWTPVQDEIAKFARVCLYDRAGYLWSEPSPRPRSIADRAADLRALLHAAQVPGPYVLVAHSYGGLIARLFARDNPADLAGMVLVDTPDEGVAFAPAYLAFTERGETVVMLLGFAARCGLVRLWSRLSPEEPGQKLPAELLSAVAAAAARGSFYDAIGDDLASLRRVPPSMRAPGAFGTLGDKPLVVINHGIPFPPPFAFIEKYWPGGIKRQLALSTRSTLMTAARSDHMIAIDEPEVIVAATRHVVDEARNRR